MFAVRLGVVVLLAALVAGPALPAAAAGQAPQMRQVAAGAPGLELMPADEIGRLIAEELARRDRGWRDATATLRMIVRDPRGEESVRELRSKRLELADGGDRRLLIFEHPADLKDTALLSVGAPRRAAEQWVFRAERGRLERIGADARSQPFAGSEFTYEDLAGRHLEAYDYQWLRSVPSDGLLLHVIERRPAGASSGYSREVLWVDAQAYRIWRVDYYDRSGELLKTLRYMAYREYRNGHWRPRVMHMSNHRTGASTTLEWGPHHFDTGLSERDFDHRQWGRGR